MGIKIKYQRSKTYTRTVNEVIGATDDTTIRTIPYTPSDANTIYVDSENGDDINTGISSSPVRTLNRAFSLIGGALLNIMIQNDGYYNDLRSLGYYKTDQTTINTVDIFPILTPDMDLLISDLGKIPIIGTAYGSYKITNNNKWDENICGCEPWFNDIEYPNKIFVDSVNGDDARSGLTRLLSKKTITSALTIVDATHQVIELSEGIYDGIIIPHTSYLHCIQGARNADVTLINQIEWIPNNNNIKSDYFGRDVGFIFHNLKFKIITDISPYTSSFNYNVFMNNGGWVTGHYPIIFSRCSFFGKEATLFIAGSTGSIDLDNSSICFFNCYFNSLNKSIAGAVYAVYYSNCVFENCIKGIINSNYNGTLINRYEYLYFKSCTDGFHGYSVANSNDKIRQMIAIDCKHSGFYLNQNTTANNLTAYNCRYGVYCNGGITALNLDKCILWNNTNDLHVIIGVTINISNSTYSTTGGGGTINPTNINTLVTFADENRNMLGVIDDDLGLDLSASMNSTDKHEIGYVAIIFNVYQYLKFENLILDGYNLFTTAIIKNSYILGVTRTRYVTFNNFIGSALHALSFIQYLNCKFISNGCGVIHNYASAVANINNYNLIFYNNGVNLNVCIRNSNNGDRISASYTYKYNRLLMLNSSKYNIVFLGAGDDATSIIFIYNSILHNNAITPNILYTGWYPGNAIRLINSCVTDYIEYGFIENSNLITSSPLVITPEDMPTNPEYWFHIRNSKLEWEENDSPCIEKGIENDDIGAHIVDWTLTNDVWSEFAPVEQPNVMPPEYIPIKQISLSTITGQKRLHANALRRVFTLIFQDDYNMTEIERIFWEYLSTLVMTNENDLTIKDFVMRYLPNGDTKIIDAMVATIATASASDNYDYLISVTNAGNWKPNQFAGFLVDYYTTTESRTYRIVKSTASDLYVIDFENVGLPSGITPKVDIKEIEVVLNDSTLNFANMINWINQVGTDANNGDVQFRHPVTGFTLQLLEY